MTKAVLILAGQREGVTDPLCEAADVSHKAEIPIAGVPMLERVIFAITQSGLSDNLYISGYSGSKLKQVSNGKGPLKRNIRKPSEHICGSLMRLSQVVICFILLMRKG